eukprot:242415-Chlamydomonas_euryale.AAC.2
MLLPQCVAMGSECVGCSVCGAACAAGAASRGRGAEPTGFNCPTPCAPPPLVTMWPLGIGLRCCGRLSMAGCHTSHSSEALTSSGLPVSIARTLASLNASNFWHATVKRSSSSRIFSFCDCSISTLTRCPSVTSFCRSLERAALSRLAMMRIAFFGSMLGSRRASPAGLRPPLPFLWTHFIRLPPTSVREPSWSSSAVTGRDSVCSSVDSSSAMSTGRSSGEPRPEAAALPPAWLRCTACSTSPVWRRLADVPHSPAAMPKCPPTPNAARSDEPTRGACFAPAGVLGDARHSGSGIERLVASRPEPVVARMYSPTSRRARTAAARSATAATGRGTQQK